MKFINMSLKKCINFHLFEEHFEPYILISIQNSGSENGIAMLPKKYCTDILSLYFDDAVVEEETNILFTRKMAREILDFVQANRGKVDLCVIHCFAGKSRSAAVASMLTRIEGEDNTRFSEEYIPNALVYCTLFDEYYQQFLDELLD